MVSRLTSASRAMLACVLIACIVLISFALAAGMHQHGVSHCCAFCHVGHLPYLTEAQVPQIPPPDALPAFLLQEEAAHTLKQAVLTSFGRAPPSC